MNSTRVNLYRDVANVYSPERACTPRMCLYRHFLGTRANGMWFEYIVTVHAETLPGTLIVKRNAPQNHDWSSFLMLLMVACIHESLIKLVCIVILVHWIHPPRHECRANQRLRSTNTLLLQPIEPIFVLPSKQITGNCPYNVRLLSTYELLN